MGDEKETLLFVVQDPNKRTVSLSANQYFGHIISSDGNHQAHPEFSPEEIKKTVEHPDVIYKSTLPDSEVYFGRHSAQYPKMFIKVPVAVYDGGSTGEVRTAHLTKTISGNIDERGLLYVKSRL